MITESLLFLVLCAFFCAYEYRSYQLAIRRAQKKNREVPLRPLLTRTTPTGSGWGVFAVCGFLISNTLLVYSSQTSYASDIMKNLNAKVKVAKKSRQPYDLKKLCEESKTQIQSTEDAPCAIQCRIGYAPDTNTCMQELQWRLATLDEWVSMVDFLFEESSGGIKRKGKNKK